MEPISTALAGIALFKSAVDGIKGAISTANDVSDIAGFIDNLFEGEKQVQQKRNQKSGQTVGDQLGIKHVAQEIIDAKLAKEQMQEIATMVDMRFGHGTWRSIVDERANRRGYKKCCFGDCCYFDYGRVFCCNDYYDS
jgi:hypothetical protein